MSWPWSRRKRGNVSAVPRGLETGSHRSPGMEVVARELVKRPDPRVLDLGHPSTESVSFLSEYSRHVSVADLFRSCGGVEGERSEAFRFPAVGELSLPENEAPFDLILIWDLLHYFDRAELPAFVARLASLGRPGTSAFLAISATLPIPPVPLHFKIESTDRLHYGVATETRLPAPKFTPREVEKLMVPFRPLRSFQLRSGLQELVFLRD